MDKEISRREFLKQGIKTVVATAVITACGKLIIGDTEAAKLSPINVGEDNFIIELDELAEHKAVDFIYKGKKSILLYNDGEIRAFENICTHRGGPSKLKNDKLVCQWHGSVFDPLTGEALKGPAPLGSKLTPIEIKENNGKIYVEGD